MSDLVLRIARICNDFTNAVAGYDNPGNVPVLPQSALDPVGNFEMGVKFKAFSGDDDCYGDASCFGQEVLNKARGFSQSLADTFLPQNYTM